LSLHSLMCLHSSRSPLFPPSMLYPDSLMYARALLYPRSRFLLVTHHLPPILFSPLFPTQNGTRTLQFWNSG
ncbi:hypothetical protein CLOM_g13229, partial [Closterium sp. NIES-68]